MEALSVTEDAPYARIPASIEDSPTVSDIAQGPDVKLRTIPIWSNATPPRGRHRLRRTPAHPFADQPAVLAVARVKARFTNHGRKGFGPRPARTGRYAERIGSMISGFHPDTRSAGVPSAVSETGRRSGSERFGRCRREAGAFRGTRSHRHRPRRTRYSRGRRQLTPSTVSDLGLKPKPQARPIPNSVGTKAGAFRGTRFFFFQPADVLTRKHRRRSGSHPAVLGVQPPGARSETPHRCARRH
jgi:hypothetical protein